MALVVLTGRPGKGKTLTMVSIAKSNFKHYNPPLIVWFKEKILRKKYIYTLNQYSDFPIIFKKERKNKKTYLYYDELGEIRETNVLSSLEFRIFDLTLINKFTEEATFFIDEIQAKYDSMEYKDFPDAIAHYCQAHRHFKNDIYISSQSQSRIIKRLLVLAEEYWNIYEFRKIFGIAWVNIRITWELSSNIETQIINENKIDVEYKTKIFKIKKTGDCYDDKYLRGLQEGATTYRSIPYNSKTMNKEQILNSFFPTEAEREKIKKMRY